MKLSDSISIEGLDFDGPVNSTEDILAQAGVYVILDARSGQYFPLDVGESSSVRERIENHDRKSCWKSHASGEVVAAVRYMPWSSLEQRGGLEGQLRMSLKPPCGTI